MRPRDLGWSERLCTYLDCLTVMSEIEAAINPHALLYDRLVILGIDWPFAGFWHLYVHVDVLRKPGKKLQLQRL